MELPLSIINKKPFLNSSEVTYDFEIDLGDLVQWIEHNLGEGYKVNITKSGESVDLEEFDPTITISNQVIDLDDLDSWDLKEYATNELDLIDPDEYECEECENRESNNPDTDNYVNIFGEKLELPQRLNLTHYYKLKEFLEQNEMLEM